MIVRVNERVDFRLSPVQWISSFAPAAENGFDFLDEEPIRSFKHAVDAAADSQNEFRLSELVFDSHFRLVAGRAEFLELLMATRAF